jgi:hypothetical protein
VNAAQAVTLRELDAACGAPKGTAFRAFKRMIPALVEGADFAVLDPVADRDAIEALRAQRRIYASSRAVVLLSSAAAARLRATLAA